MYDIQRNLFHMTTYMQVGMYNDCVHKGKSAI